MKNFTRNVMKKTKYKVLISTVVIITAFFAYNNLNKIFADSSNSWTFNYTGDVQSFTFPEEGDYKITAIGAGSTAPCQLIGSGTAISGIYHANAGETLYITVGGRGEAKLGGAAGGYNGGGTSYGNGGSGGGATSITKTNRGTLDNFNNNLDEVLMVAGGAGGVKYNPYDVAVTYLANYYFSIYFRDYYDMRTDNYFTIYDDSFIKPTDMFWLVHTRYYGDNLLQQGVGIEDERIDTLTPGEKTAIQTNSLFGKGQDNASGSNYGAGGGGLVGGISGDAASTYGNGGQSAISSDVDLVLQYRGGSESHGSVTIQKLNYSSTLTVYLHDAATVDGNSIVYSIEKNENETYDLNEIIDNMNDGYFFNGFDLTTSDTNGGSINNSTNIFTFGKKDSIIDLLYKTTPVINSQIRENPDNSKTLIVKGYMNGNDSEEIDILKSINDGANEIVASEQITCDNVKPIVFNFTGSVQEYEIPVSGYYKIECYGGGDTGGDLNAASGGYAKGQTYFEAGDIIYVYVGARENKFNGGGEVTTVSADMKTASCGTYNGVWTIYAEEGRATSQDRISYGSGATDVRLVKSTAADGWSGDDSLLSRLVTAGGGGGQAVLLHRHVRGDYTGGIGTQVTSGVLGLPNSYSNGVLGLGSAGVHDTSGYGQLRPGIYNPTQDYNFGATGGGGGGWYGGACTIGDEMRINGTNSFGWEMHSYAGTNNVQDVYQLGDRYYYTTDAVMTEGISTDDGRCILTYLGDMYSCDFEYFLPMEDIDAPNKPVLGVETVDSTSYSIFAFDGIDNGTKYKYTLYNAELEFNEIIVDVVTSNVKGYYYIFDSNPDTVVTTSDTYTTNTTFNKTIGAAVEYLHIACVDTAGNLSETTTLKLGEVDVICQDIDVRTGEVLGTSSPMTFDTGSTVSSSDFGAAPNYSTHTFYADETKAISGSDNIVHRYYEKTNPYVVYDNGTTKYYNKKGSTTGTDNASITLIDTLSLSTDDYMHAYVYSDGTVVLDGDGNNVTYSNSDTTIFNTHKDLIKTIATSNGTNLEFKPKNSISNYFKELTNDDLALDVRTLNLDYLNNIEYLFSYENLGCKYESINITNLDVTKFTSLKGFFSNQDNLINIIGLTTLDTQNAIDISYMFSGLDKLKLIDLSNFSFDDVTYNKYFLGSPSEYDMNKVNLEVILPGDVGYNTYYLPNSDDALYLWNGYATDNTMIGHSYAILPDAYSDTNLYKIKYQRRSLDTDPNITYNNIPNYTYSSRFMILPNPEIFDNGTRLVLNTDYTVTLYDSSDNVIDNVNKYFVNAGDYRAVVTGIGKYNGEITFPFRVNTYYLSIDLTDTKYLNSLSDEKVYDGNTDLTVNSNTSNKDKVVIVDGVYTEKLNITLDGMYDNKEASNAKNKSLYFKEKSITITDSDSNLSNKSVSNYQIVYKYLSSDKTDYVKVLNAGNITSKNISDSDITHTSNIASKVYTGSSITLTASDIANIALTDTRISYLLKDTDPDDYDISYSNNINKGTAHVTFTGKNNYTGSFTLDYSITEKTVDTGLNVTIANNNLVYNGKDRTTSELGISVYDNDKGSYLVLDTDYRLTFDNPNDASSVNTKYKNIINNATCYIEGLGNYKGVTSINFNILPYKINKSDLLISDSDKEIKKYKDGTNKVEIRDVSFFDKTNANEVLHPYYNFDIDGTNYEHITFTYDKAYVSDNLGNYVFNGEMDNTDTSLLHHKSITIEKLNIDRTNTLASNFIFVKDDNITEVTTSDNIKKTFDNASYLIDKTDPVVVSTLLLDSDTHKVYGANKDIEFNLVTSEELNVDMSKKNNIVLEYQLGDSTSNVFTIPLTSVNDILAAQEDNRITTLKFKGKIPSTLAKDNTYYLRNVSLRVTDVSISDVITDMAGNPLNLHLDFNLNDIYVDTRGWSVDITHDKDSSLPYVSDYLVKFIIDFDGTILDDSYTSDEVIDKFVLSIKDLSNSDDATNTINISNLKSVPNSGITVNTISPKEKYEIDIDTRLMSLIGLNDTLGKTLTLSLDKNSLLDNLNNYNITCSKSLKIIRTVSYDTLDILNDFVFTYEGDTLGYDKINNTLIDLTNNKEVLFYKDDIITIASSKVIDTVRSFVHFVSNLNGDTNSNALTKDKDSIDYKVTTNDLLSDMYLYFTNWAHSKMFNVNINLLTLSDICTMINEDVLDDAILSDSEINDIKNILGKDKNILLIDPNDPTRISIEVNDGMNKYINYNNNLILPKELARRIMYEDLILDDTNILDTIIDILKDLDNKEKFEDSTEDIEAKMIRYQKLKGWVKELIKDDSNTLDLFDKYYGNKDNLINGLIEGYDLKNDLSDNEQFELFGAVTKTDKLDTDKLKLTSLKLTSKKDLDDAYDILSAKIDPSELILIPYDLTLTKTNNNTEVPVKAGEKALIRLKMPNEYNKVKVRLFDKDGELIPILDKQLLLINDKGLAVTKDIDPGINPSTYKDNYLFFETDKVDKVIVVIGDYITSTVITTSGDLNGGSTDPSGYVKHTDGLDTNINISLNNNYRAEIYKNDKLDKTITSGTCYIVKDEELADSNVYLNIKFIKEQPKDDGGNKKDISTSTITIQVIDHIPYIDGYKDKTFKPNNNMTRAEFAKILATLSQNYKLSDKSDNLKYNDKYKDVNDSAWYSNYVGYLTKCNLLKGYKDGTFKPNAYIKRSEVSKVLSEMFNISDNNIKNIYYNEIKGKWYESSVSKLVKGGYLKGYPDGTIKANNNITRAEVVALVNRILDRDDYNDNKTKTYKSNLKDISNNKWYYQDVIEASLAHNISELH